MAMYKALYDFESGEDQALTFAANDTFTVMETVDQYWWMVQNGYGQVGYVPANYLAKDDVGHGEVVKSIDRAIEAVHFQATCNGGQYSPIQRSNLQKLLQHRKTVVEQHRLERSPSLTGQNKGPAPSPPALSSSANAPNSPDLKRNASGRSSKRTAPAPPISKPAPEDLPATPPRTPRKVSSPIDITPNSFTCRVGPEGHRAGSEGHDSSPRLHSHSPRTMGPNSPAPASPRHFNFQIPQGCALELVEHVRRNTGLSHDKSKVAVGTVLGHLRDNIPGLKIIMDDILKDILKNEAGVLEGSHDTVRLHVIFSEMAACKDDSQQRSWALHEDESVILEYLHELWSILTNADQNICRDVVSQDGFNAVHTLVLYYQMEARVSIRVPLLKIFGALCGLDGHIISELLTSVLPLELARDMQTDTKDITKLSHSALVMTMIFSMGESLPIHHYDHLSRSFISFLLENLENPDEAIVASEEGEDVLDIFVNLILAFNLHFEMPSENPVMAVLAEHGTAKTFTEKLLLLFNRGDDPVRIFEHEPKPPDSLLKFMSDLYSSTETSGLLYTNDAKVLIDIVSRQISDLSPADRLRTDYLSLTHLIIKNSDYEEHQHRRDDLQVCFTRIASEEFPDSDMDRRIVAQIYADFPQYFKSCS